MKKLTHLDLFSGIGGAALAVDTVWPGSEHTFVEIDPFCQAVLKKH
jgi:site-specific DNA-cytosine methylase